VSSRGVLWLRAGEAGASSGRAGPGGRAGLVGRGELRLRLMGQVEQHDAGAPARGEEPVDRGRRATTAEVRVASGQASEG
jgi:hypothetical protein